MVRYKRRYGECEICERMYEIANVILQYEKTKEIRELCMNCIYTVEWFKEINIPCDVSKIRRKIRVIN